MLINTHNLQVCVHTTWWNRDENKFAFYRGWPSNKDEDPLRELETLWNMQSRKKKKPCVSVSLYTALTNRSNCSSYLVQYAPTPLNVRLRTQSLNPVPYQILREHGGLNMILAIFDIDAHESIDIEDWFNDQIPKLDNLLEAHPGLFIYRSKGGMRILGILPTPIPLTSHEDADAWTRRYSAWCNYLARRFGLRTEGKETADKLADWTRYQRVPHDCRVKGEPASEYETIGNPSLIGTWDPVLEQIDWPVMAITSHEHREYEGECQLLQLVRMSGLEHEMLADGVWDIHCPDAACHSDSSHRKTKTVLYTNGYIGKIECKSTGCQSKHPDKNVSYLSCFKPELVVKTSKAVAFDPLVLRIQDRMERRSGRIDWDTPEDSPIFDEQAADEFLLQKAKEFAAFGRTASFKDTVSREVFGRKNHSIYHKLLTSLPI